MALTTDEPAARVSRPEPAASLSAFRKMSPVAVDTVPVMVRLSSATRETSPAPATTTSPTERALSSEMDTPVKVPAPVVAMPKVLKSFPALLRSTAIALRSEVMVVAPVTATLVPPAWVSAPSLTITSRVAAVTLPSCSAVLLVRSTLPVEVTVTAPLKSLPVSVREMSPAPVSKLEAPVTAMPVATVWVKAASLTITSRVAAVTLPSSSAVLLVRSTLPPAVTVTAPPKSLLVRVREMKLLAFRLEVPVTTKGASGDACVIVSPVAVRVP